MHSEDPTASLDTKEWVERVNGRGLYIISHGAYRLFMAIEMAVRSKLTEYLRKKRKTEDCKEATHDLTVYTCFGYMYKAFFLPCTDKVWKQ